MPWLLIEKAMINVDKSSLYLIMIFKISYNIILDHKTNFKNSF